MSSQAEHGLKPDRLAPFLVPYGLNQAGLEFLGYSQNYVYACQRESGKCILRISHGRYRTKIQVEAELTWIQFLTSRGIKACSPIPAMNGELCLAFGLDGDHYIVTCFENAPGQRLLPQEIGPQLYYKLGQLLGKMHRESAAFVVNEGTAVRPHWFDSRLIREDVAQHRANLPDRFCESVSDLLHQLQELPVSSTTYGLIHGDVSFNNCFLYEDDLWIFDFDNCEQGHFLQDVATVLYDTIYCRALNKFADPALNDRIAPLWETFWAGYVTAGPQRHVPAIELKRFFLLREAVIYIHYHRILDQRNVSETFRAGLDVMRSNVERQQHQVDFVALAAILAR
jgi:amicoumacin kinase